MAFDLRALLAIACLCDTLMFVGFCIFWVAALKRRPLSDSLTVFTSHRSADFHLHLQLKSPLQNVLTWQFCLWTCSPLLISLFTMIFQPIIQRFRWSKESNMNSQSPVTTTINPCALANVPRDRGDASVSSSHSAALFLRRGENCWAAKYILIAKSVLSPSRANAMKHLFGKKMRNCSHLINYQREAVELVQHSNMCKQLSNLNNR